MGRSSSPTGSDSKASVATKKKGVDALLNGFRSDDVHRIAQSGTSTVQQVRSAEVPSTQRPDAKVIQLTNSSPAVVSFDVANPFGEPTEIENADTPIWGGGVPVATGAEDRVAASAAFDQLFGGPQDANRLSAPVQTLLLDANGFSADSASAGMMTAEPTAMVGDMSLVMPEPVAEPIMATTTLEASIPTIPVASKAASAPRSNASTPSGKAAIARARAAVEAGKTASPRPGVRPKGAATGAPKAAPKNGGRR
jgi:hypothetical protein